MTLFGWDASHYDWSRGSMDLVAAKAAGISFMTHKIGEGTDYTDAKFATFYKRAKAAGLPLIGAYYVNHNGNQNAQADRFLALLDAQAPGWRDGPFILQIDSERWDQGTPTPAEVEAFAHRLLASAPQFMPVIYGPKWVYGDLLKGAGVPLWASNYGSNPTEAFRTAYPGDSSDRWAAYSGETPEILQYGSKTRIGGQGTCDANAFRGTLAELTDLVYPAGDDNVTPAQLTAAVEAAVKAMMPQIAQAVWAADVIEATAAPVANADYATNPTWPAHYALYASVDSARRARYELNADVTEIKAAIAAIPAASGADPDVVAAKVVDLLASRLGPHAVGGAVKMPASA